ncbi:tol-pal system-associated acyl-CoA thioesterase [Ampullimonas aquatilis]|uniref:tol-pal system-associated acyl-CoA thioesterase n=1 Tax=Ampullimonas aquatilis TaxID=1341549 RepID=UPI003C71C041
MTMTPTAAFSTTFRVYYEDTDAGGVIFYANYLKFFERARTEWLRSLGFGQHDLSQQTNTIFMVVNTSVDYLKPGRLDDLLHVTVDIEKVGRASMNFNQGCYRLASNGTELEKLSHGSITVCCVDLDKLKPTAIPEVVRNKIRTSSTD